MLGNFLRRSKDNKQLWVRNKNFLAHVTLKQNVEIYSPASNGSKRTYTEYIGFLSPSLEAAVSIFNASIFV